MQSHHTVPVHEIPHIHITIRFDDKKHP